MVLALNLFLWSLSYAQEYIGVGDKYYLPKSSSYHFSDQTLIEFHNDVRPFIISKKTGILKYKTDLKEKDLFILDQNQIKFFKNTKEYIKNVKHLEFSFSSKKLKVIGDNPSLEEINFLLKHCNQSKLVYLDFNFFDKQPKVNKYLLDNFNLKTQIYQNKLIPTGNHHSLSQCLNLKKKEKTYLAHIILVEKDQSLSRGAGLGSSGEVPWILSDNKLNFQELSGSASYKKIKDKTRELLNFKSLISIKRPLKFSSGLEFQVIEQAGLFNSRRAWKKASTDLDLSILNEMGGEILLKSNIKQTSRTGTANTFKVNSLEKEDTLLLNQWVKLTSYSKNLESRSKTKSFGSSIIGSRLKDKSKITYELWIKLNPYG